MAQKGNPNFGKKTEVSQETNDTQEPEITKSEVKDTEILYAKEEKPSSEAVVPMSEVVNMAAGIAAKIVEERLKNFQPQSEQIKERIVYAPVASVNDIPELENWEVKDRTYILADGSKPISFSIRHQHTPYSSLNYFNKVTNKVHALRYATNQPSFFIDQQSTELGSVSVAHILFKYGTLHVPASEITLQKFLHITPDNGTIFKEFDPKEKINEVLEKEDLDFSAKSLARSVGDIANKSIASLVCPGFSEDWDIGTVKSEIYAYIKKEPAKYIELTKDPKLKAKGIAKTAMSRGYLKFSNYKFINEKNEVVLEVPRNINEYDAIAEYFASSEGRSFYEYLMNAIS